MKVFWVFILSISFFYLYDSFKWNRKVVLKIVEDFTPSRYSEKTSVRTVTKMPSKSQNKVNDSITPIPNKDFVYSPKQFEIDDTELLRELNLECTPDTFGYSIEKGLSVFPDFTYPKCTALNKQNDTYIHIDRSTNTLYMDCPDSNKKIIMGPIDDRKLVRSNEVFYSWEVEDYKGPVDASGIEFALGTCENDEYFMQGTMQPIFNKSAYESAKTKMTSKPKLIYFLTLDSMSRRHFFRKLPRVIKFLNDLNKKDEFSVFDFKLHNILGPDSISNQVPLMGGKAQYKREFEGNQNIDYLGKFAMWNMLRDKGYVSLLGLENCDNYFPGALGRKPNVDYSVGPFYCAVQKYSGVMFDKEFERVQRCLGGHQTHYYILNYTRTVVEMNKGVNLWLYNHLNAAHEASGQHAATMNDDITEYLEDFLDRFKNDFEIFIYLHADHGMRYGNWFIDTEAYQENKLPSLFIISSNSLLANYPFSYFSLKTNSERLTSKLDLRQTTLFLAGVNYTEPNAVNLLNDTVKKSRVCKDSLIEAWDCSCNPMELVIEPSFDIDKILQHLKKYAEKIINSASYADPRYPLGKYCKQVFLTNITKVYHVGISNVDEFYKLEIESDARKGMKFQTNFILSADKKASLRDGFMIENVLYGSRIRAKVLSISRLDAFAGPCEIQSRNKGLKPEFCACKDID